ncbi:MAG: gliding motility lipoprotein GldH [Bacteroidales bacterium]|jgi:gliding motility-associated lipoprotein GldH|nr:gliding motility lipoprotein GldH [Bacteroidales bacterium]
MKNKNVFFSLFLSIIAILFFCCNNNIVYDETQKVNEKGWNMNEKKIFKVDIQDTIQRYDFAINLRNTTQYKNSNIFFFIKTIYPDNSITLCDTIECYLTYLDGSWVGKGSGRLKDNRFWFSHSVTFPQKGEYVFEIQQATRDTNLIGISDIGIHIEYHKEEKAK